MRTLNLHQGVADWLVNKGASGYRKSSNATFFSPLGESNS